MPQYSESSTATSSLFYSALGSPRDLSGRSKIFSQGLSLAPQKAFLPLHWAVMLRMARVPFPAACRLFFTVPPLSGAVHCPVLLFPIPPPRLLIPPPAPNEQDPNSGLSLEIIMQLHWQKTSVFDDISSRDGDLAGSQMLSLGGFHSLVKITGPICAENADFAMSSYIPMGIIALYSFPSCWERPHIHGAPAPMICWGRGCRSTACSHHRPPCNW